MCTVRQARMIGGGDGDHRRQLLSNECEVVVACGDTDPSKSSAESEERLALLKDGFRRARRQVTMRPRRMIMMAGSVTQVYSGVTLLREDQSRESRTSPLVGF